MLRSRKRHLIGDQNPSVEELINFHNATTSLDHVLALVQCDIWYVERIDKLLVRPPFQ